MAPILSRLLLLAVAGMALAQTIVPANSTYAGMNDANVLEMVVANDRSDGSSHYIHVAGLTSGANSTPNGGFQGRLLLANASSQLSLAADDIALISCDPYTGNIQPSDVFAEAQSRNVTAIVLYSESVPSCQLTNQEGEYQRVYTVINQNYTRYLLQAVTTMGANVAQIATRASLTGNYDTGGNSTGGGNGNTPWGPSPSTAVAMIILYSITGIITALFLLIIITGAVRAHRHPERYGPRNGIGRPRQSRARGLAMAMLETIPIVKFGDRTEPPKTADVELGSTTGHGQVEMLPDNDAHVADEQRETTADTVVAGKKNRPELTTANSAGESSTPRPQEPESGIAAAIDKPSTPPVQESSAQGCSICTEDFQVGEDQRVLPCDHRFHPACIDPWLLNVSGTCPLCRIDLRPQTSNVATEDGEGELAPPLNEAGAARRNRFGGFSRPGRLTNEERQRVLELRGTGQVEERGARERLRNVFRIRTRRTGEGEERQQSEDATTAATGSASEGGR